MFLGELLLVLRIFIPELAVYLGSELPTVSARPDSKSSPVSLRQICKIDFLFVSERDFFLCELTAAFKIRNCPP